jgi:prepilin-type N-terminal cleavage/methylation domain-containing protein
MDALRVLVGRRRPSAGRRVRRRRGLTLAEVLIALVILSTALVGMARFLWAFGHTTKNVSNTQRALDLISNRLDSVTRQPDYAGIDSMGSAGGLAQSITIDSTTYTRKTYITHTGGSPTDTVDFKTITVSVAQPSFTQAVEKTTIVAAH